MLQRILALTIKEFYAIWQDKRSRMMLIVPPIIQMFIFAYAATLEAVNLSTAILNQDSAGYWSNELQRRVEASPLTTQLQHLESVAEITPRMDGQEVLLTLHIPQDFSRQIESGGAASVQIILDGRRTNTAQIANGYLARIIDELNHEIALRQGRSLPPGEIVVRNWYNPNLDYLWFTLPGLMCVLVTLIGLLVTALSVAREREMGTFEQTLVSPLTPTEILIGKTIPALGIGLLEAMAFFACAVYIFGIPFYGSISLLIVSLTVFMLAIIGIGLFISSISKTQQQAILGVFLFMVPAVLLSGFATPIDNMPEWFQSITYLNPIRYIFIIVKGIFLKDIPWTAAYEHLWPMALIAAITLALAGWMFRARLE